jgi:hypothetical protein
MKNIYFLSKKTIWGICNAIQKPLLYTLLPIYKVPPNCKRKDILKADNGIGLLLDIYNFYMLD